MICLVALTALAPTGEEPRVMFLHYWGVGPTEKLARGLRGALDQTHSQ